MVIGTEPRGTSISGHAIAFVISDIASTRFIDTAEVLLAAPKDANCGVAVVGRLTKRTHGRDLDQGSASILKYYQTA